MKKNQKRRVGSIIPGNEAPALKKMLRMARFTLICFFLGLMQVWAIDSYSQMSRLSLTVKSERLANVLKKIEDQSDYFFLYNRDLVDVDQLVTIKTENKTIGAILDDLFEGKDISYFMFDRQIVLTNRKSVEEVVTQQRAVTGTVTDLKGQPLPAVTVVIKGTTRGAITANNGSYSIANIPADATLVFSFVGMKTQEIVVGNSSTINVVMQEESIGIEDVVAVGYGSMRRKDLTGSVSSVTASDLVDKPVTNFVQALQGKAAGLSVISSHGEQGAEMIIRIRGGNSLKNDNKPLIVVDGIPTDIDLNSIAPEDIKSIDILKDASSTAIYGSRGANGVMMITTNRGSVGKPSINFSTYMGFDQLRNKLTVLNGREYAELANERYKISGLQPKYSEAFLRDSTAGTDWQDELFRTGPVKNYQLSVSCLINMGNINI